MSAGGWERGGFLITEEQTPARRVQGIICGDIGIHVSFGGASVTLIPLGRRLGPIFPDLGQAWQFACALDGVNWEETIEAKQLPKQLRAMLAKIRAVVGIKNE